MDKWKNELRNVNIMVQNYYFPDNKVEKIAFAVKLG